MKAITTDFQVLTCCKTFFSNLYTKAKTNKTIQEELLKPIQPKITHEENQKLTQQITLAGTTPCRLSDGKLEVTWGRWNTN